MGNCKSGEKAPPPGVLLKFTTMDDLSTVGLEPKPKPEPKRFQPGAKLVIPTPPRTTREQSLVQYWEHYGVPMSVKDAQELIRNVEEAQTP